MGDIPGVVVHLRAGATDAKKDEVAGAVLAIDPGRAKCGLAVGQPGPGGRVLGRAVVASTRLAETVRDWIESFHVTRIVIGNRTGSREIKGVLAGIPDLPPTEFIDEVGTTLEARLRYFRDHPPKGWRRLVPIALQLPPEHYDDYVAIMLLERSRTAVHQAED